MNRKSFLKTLFTGLVATRLALQLGASEVDKNQPNKKAIEEIMKFIDMESARASQEIVRQFLEYPKTPICFPGISKFEPWTSTNPPPQKP